MILYNSIDASVAYGLLIRFVCVFFVFALCITNVVAKKCIASELMLTN